MMVMKKNKPNMAWDIAIQMPPNNNHKIFITVDRIPVALSVKTDDLPNGHNAREASFRVWKPNGIPMMVIIKSMLDIKYSMAIKIPPNTNQMILPNNRIKLFFAQYKKHIHNRMNIHEKYQFHAEAFLLTQGLLFPVRIYFSNVSISFPADCNSHPARPNQEV